MSTLAKIFGEAFTKPNYPLEDFLDHTYGTVSVDLCLARVLCGLALEKREVDGQGPGSVIGGKDTAIYRYSVQICDTELFEAETIVLRKYSRLLIPSPLLSFSIALRRRG